MRNTIFICNSSQGFLVFKDTAREYRILVSLALVVEVVFQQRYYLNAAFMVPDLE